MWGVLMVLSCLSPAGHVLRPVDTTLSRAPNTVHLCSQCCERITGKCNWRRRSCLVLCWSHSGWCVNGAYLTRSVSKASLQEPAGRLVPNGSAMSLGFPVMFSCS